MKLRRGIIKSINIQNTLNNQQLNHEENYIDLLVTIIDQVHMNQNKQSLDLMEYFEDNYNFDSMFFKIESNFISIEIA